MLALRLIDPDDYLVFEDDPLIRLARDRTPQSGFGPSRDTRLTARCAKTLDDAKHFFKTAEARATIGPAPFKPIPSALGSPNPFCWMEPNGD